jgi:hypothetical protein
MCAGGQGWRFEKGGGGIVMWCGSETPQLYVPVIAFFADFVCPAVMRVSIAVSGAAGPFVMASFGCTLAVVHGMLQLGEVKRRSFPTA